MKIFTKDAFRGLDFRLKAFKLRTKARFASCVPSAANHHPFDIDSPEPALMEKGVVVERPSMSEERSPSPPIVAIHPPTASNTIQESHWRHTAPREPVPTSKRKQGPSATPSAASWFASLNGQDSGSELSVMVFNRDVETGEILDPDLERSPLDEAAYRYHYTLRRIHQRKGIPRPDSPSPTADFSAAHYTRLRDNGLISTSFDDFRPLLADEDIVEASRHPKLAVLFSEVDDDDDASASGISKDKYAKEQERDSKEVFLDAGLWGGGKRSVSSSTFGRGKTTHIPTGGPSSSVKSSPERAFYTHDNQSLQLLPSIDSNTSTHVFSPEPFSPDFARTHAQHDGEESHGTPSSESATTEDEAHTHAASMSISKLNYDNFASPPSTATASAYVSPGAPPNTPFDPTVPEAKPLARRSRVRKDSASVQGRRASRVVIGRRRASAITASQAQQQNHHFEGDYSFISFATPPRVSLPVAEAILPLVQGARTVSAPIAASTRPSAIPVPAVGEAHQRKRPASKSDFVKAAAAASMFPSRVDGDVGRRRRSLPPLPSTPGVRRQSVLDLVVSPATATSRTFVEESVTPDVEIIKKTSKFSTLFRTPVKQGSRGATSNAKSAGSGPRTSPPAAHHHAQAVATTKPSWQPRFHPEVLGRSRSQAAAATHHDTVLVSSFAEGLNKALDVLETLADSSAVAPPVLAYASVGGGVPSESVYSDPEEIGSKFSKSGFGSPLSRFSEELAESDTDDTTGSTSVSEGGGPQHTKRKPRPGTGGAGETPSRLPTQRGGRNLAGGHFGFKASRNYKKILELYTLQYQMYNGIDGGRG